MHADFIILSPVLEMKTELSVFQAIRILLDVLFPQQLKGDSRLLQFPGEMGEEFYKLFGFTWWLILGIERLIKVAVSHVLQIIPNKSGIFPSGYGFRDYGP